MQNIQEHLLIISGIIYDLRKDGGYNIKIEKATVFLHTNNKQNKKI
jgi:hypothetical protein